MRRRERRVGVAAERLADPLELREEPARRVDRGGADVGVGAVPLLALEDHLDRAVPLVRADGHEARRLADDRVARVHPPLREEPLRAEAAHLLVGGEEQGERGAGGAGPGGGHERGAEEALRVGGAAPDDPPVALGPSERLGPVRIERDAVGVPDEREATRRLGAAPADEVPLHHPVRVGPRVAAGVEPERPRLPLEQIEHRQVRARGGRVGGDEGPDERDEVHAGRP